MKRIKNTLKSIFKNQKKYLVIGGVLVLAVLGYFVFGKGSGKTEMFTVKRADVVQSVVLSGKVQTSSRADLGFASSGRVSRIFVKNNQEVSSGAMLAQLEIGDLLADLKIKQANAKTSDVDLESAKEELERVTAREKTKVASAYRALLTEGLELVPDSDTYTVEPPALSGIYDGPEGRYKIILKRASGTSGDLEMFTFDLEQTRRLVNNEGPTPVGTGGLFVSFPGNNLSEYRDTTWFLDIPNKASSSYLANFNAHNEAKNERDLAIKNAEFDYQKLLTEDGGGSSVAQAEIQKINAEIRKNTIYAPFMGKVTNIAKEVGENASVGERVISILGEDKLEVVLQVSELDVSRLVPGASIQLALDAFPGEEFTGTLKTVNSRDTQIEGVPVYEAFVDLEPNKSNSRIKTGMSATGTIVLAMKQSVLSIPNYFVKKAGGKDVVQVVDAKGNIMEQEVTLGLVGTDSMVEVVSGLSEGEEIKN